MANTETTNIPLDLVQGDATGVGGSALDAADMNIYRGYGDNVAQAALRALGLGVILDGTPNAGLLSAGAGVTLNVAAGAANILVSPAINGCLGFVPLRWIAGANLVPAGMTDNATWYIVLSVVIPSTYATGGTVNPDSRRDQRATLAAQLTAQATSARPNGGILLGKVTWLAGVATFDHSFRDVAGNGAPVLPDVIEPAVTTNKLYSIASGVLKWAGKRIPVIASALSNSQYVKTDGSGNLITAAAIPESDITGLVADLALKAPLASPTLTGTPAVPTAAADTNTTQAASTAFVLGQAGAASPLGPGAAAAGTSPRYSRQDHVHPTDTSRAAAARTITAGTGLSGGGDLSADRTVALANTAVTPGTYPSPTSITVDAQGRITAIS